MKSYKKYIYGEYKLLINNLDNITDSLKKLVDRDAVTGCTVEVTGRIAFKSTGSMFDYASLADFREALSLEDINDIEYILKK